MSFLRDSGERFTGHLAGDWLNTVQFYSTSVRSLGKHMTGELLTRGQPGFWSKLHSVDCVLWSLASLVPVRAIGAVFFFRERKLSAVERIAYLSYRRVAEDSLACGEQFNSEIFRQRAASLRDNAEFWQSLNDLTKIVDKNIPSDGDRLVNVIVVLRYGKIKAELYLSTRGFRRQSLELWTVNRARCERVFMPTIGRSKHFRDLIQGVNQSQSVKRLNSSTHPLPRQTQPMIVYRPEMVT